MNQDRPCLKAIAHSTRATSAMFTSIYSRPCPYFFNDTLLELSGFPSRAMRKDSFAILRRGTLRASEHMFAGSATGKQNRGLATGRRQQKTGRRGRAESKWAKYRVMSTTHMIKIAVRQPKRYRFHSLTVGQPSTAPCLSVSFCWPRQSADAW